MNPDELEESLLKTLEESDLSALTADLAEVGLDQLVYDGVVKDVPVFSTILKLYNLSIGVSNRLLAKKLLKFLTALADVPIQQRRKQISKLVVDQSHRTAVGENLLLLIDRLNDMRKPEMMAKVFKAFLLEKIVLEQFYELAYAVDMVHVASLTGLSEIYNNETSTEPLKSSAELQHLAMCGLIAHYWKGEDGVRTPFGYGGGFVANDLGRLFVEIVL